MSETPDPLAAAGFWTAIETLHDVVYFAPDAKQRYQDLGLRGYWMGYFASRAAALGTPSPEVVTAAFHGFAPGMVARAVPDCWSRADRDDVLATRVAVACDALAEPAVDHDVAGLAEALAPVVAGIDPAGKPLAAGEAALEVPDDALGALWRRATVLREYRGDVHVALLVGLGLGGAAANALQVASGRGPAEQRMMRGWTETEWDDAVASLRARGWVDDDGRATDAGHAVRDGLEHDTDRVCAAFLTPAAREAASAVAPALLALARDVAASGAIPYPNPVGVAAP